MMRAQLLIALFLFSSLATWAELISTGVGLVRNQVVTSREVQIQNLLDAALYEPKAKERLKIIPIDSKGFGKAVSDTLLETVVALEAQNFNLVQLSPEEVRAAEKKALKILKPLSIWKNLQVSPQELGTAVSRKIQAKKFIQFRAKSSVLPVTDSEAQKYFSENRLKFGNLPFENFKENIKSYLSRANVDRRLKDWYDVLLNKYQVKNLIAEM